MEKNIVNACIRYIGNVRNPGTGSIANWLSGTAFLLNSLSRERRIEDLGEHEGTFWG